MNILAYINGYLGKEAIGYGGSGAAGAIPGEERLKPAKNRLMGLARANLMPGVTGQQPGRKENLPKMKTTETAAKPFAGNPADWSSFRKWYLNVFKGRSLGDAYTK